MWSWRFGSAVVPLFPAVVLGATVASCSLGLDESLIDKQADGGAAFDGALPDGGSDLPDGGRGTPDAGGPIACTDDGPCKATDGCLTGHCDLGRKVCVYDVCRSACGAATCDKAAHTCGQPTTYKYKVTQIALGASVCGRCAVAMYPWLFVILGSGLEVLDVSNPAVAAPPKVPVTGLDFTPTQIAASGNRIWLTGPLRAAPPTVPIAYIDVPTDPFTADIVATSANATTTDRGPVPGFFLFPRAPQSALLVEASAQFPSAIVDAPLPNPLSLTPTPIPATPDTSPVVSTGTRLLLSGTAATPTFQLVEGAGSTTPTGGSVVTLASLTNASPSRAFAGSPEGAVTWTYGVTALGGDPPAPTSTTGAQAGFLVDGATAQVSAAQATVGIETYNDVDNPIGPAAAVVGPIAMLDPGTAMVTAVAHDNTGQTSVQFVTKNPPVVVSDGAAPRRALVPAPIGAIVAATASDGIAYVVANATAAPGTATLYVFDGTCAP